MEEGEMLLPNSDHANFPPPMEGSSPTQTESSSTADEAPSTRFDWEIEIFEKFNTKKLYSNSFYAGGCKWKILIFPKGKNVDHLSLYLAVADSKGLPHGWSIHAQFSLAVINRRDARLSVRKADHILWNLHVGDDFVVTFTETQHRFNARETDWGFISFMPLCELYDPNRDFLENGSIMVQANVSVPWVVDYWSPESKKETAFVGLMNQGATCYMNSLLQTLYHIPYFRKAVYHMPTTKNDEPSGNIPLALQSLFYKLQYSDTSVATKELTESFGWDAYDPFMQHDAQEFSRLLCERIEDKMKGTTLDGTIQQLFEGHQVSQMECINVDYKSSIKEFFYDLQLDVKGCRDVYASFDKYVEVECLEGYHVDLHGLQEAKKHVLFIDFPPVLQLQLKRFEYDFIRNTMVKINDRYEFPLQLDLDRENGKYLSPKADRSVRNLYTLHSVLVHCGRVDGGHYYVYVRPTLSDQWFKFDDDRVTKEVMERALEEQFGGKEEIPKCSNAYMLVYIRESDKEKIICDVDEKDIPQHLKTKLKKEQEEKDQRRKEKAEAHPYTIVKVAHHKDLLRQIGKDIYFDLVDLEKVAHFQIQNQMSFHHLKEQVAKAYHIPMQVQRFWLWAYSQNRTYRPRLPLPPQAEALSVGYFGEFSILEKELNLFLDEDIQVILDPVHLLEKNKDDILLFFKLYNPLKEELRYVGRKFVKSTAKPVQILSTLNEMAGFAPDEEIDLYEEREFEPKVICVPINKNLRFRASNLVDGDIIWFQKSSKAGNGEQFRYPDVPSFLEYVHNRQVVHFRTLEKPHKDEFLLELSKLHKYDKVVERVAGHLGLDDPSKIRLTSHNCYSQKPKLQPIKYCEAECLSDMLVHYNETSIIPTSDILYYEVLDIPLPELQGLKTLKVVFHHTSKAEVSNLTITLPKQSTVGDVLDELKTKVELSQPNAELRLLEVFCHKIYKIFPLKLMIENIDDQYWTLHAEEIPKEEKNVGPYDSLIHVSHFMKTMTVNQGLVQNFGEPFLLVICEGETLAEVKIRIQKKLQVPDEEFLKWKFAFLLSGRPEYLQDSDILSSRFLKRDIYDDREQYLGLEHANNASKSSYAANQNHQKEKTLKIYN